MNTDYIIKFKGNEYTIHISNILGSYQYEIEFGGIVMSEKNFFEDILDDSIESTLRSAVMEICDADEESYKTIMRDLLIDEIIE